MLASVLKQTQQENMKMHGLFFIPRFSSILLLDTGHMWQAAVFSFSSFIKVRFRYLLFSTGWLLSIGSVKENRKKKNRTSPPSTIKWRSAGVSLETWTQSDKFHLYCSSLWKSWKWKETIKFIIFIYLLRLENASIFTRILKQHIAPYNQLGAFGAFHEVLIFPMHSWAPHLFISVPRCLSAIHKRRVFGVKQPITLLWMSKSPFQMCGVTGGSKTLCSTIDRHVAAREAIFQFLPC